MSGPGEWDAGTWSQRHVPYKDGEGHERDGRRSGEKATTRREGLAECISTTWACMGASSFFSFMISASKTTASPAQHQQQLANQSIARSLKTGSLASFLKALEGIGNPNAVEKVV